MALSIVVNHENLSHLLACHVVKIRSCFCFSCCFYPRRWAYHSQIKKSFAIQKPTVFISTVTLMLWLCGKNHSKEIQGGLFNLKSWTWKERARFDDVTILKKRGLAQFPPSMTSKIIALAPLLKKDRRWSAAAAPLLHIRCQEKPVFTTDQTFFSF